MMNTEHILEFDKIKEIWANLAVTEWAKAEIRNTIPFMSERELTARQRETTEARILLEKAGNPPLSAFEGIQEMLNAAERGQCLSALELEKMEGTLVSFRRLKDYLGRCRQYGVPLAFYDENLEELDAVREQIAGQIRGGEVVDYASRLLKSIRGQIDETENRMREKADTLLRNNKECMSDHFSTYRNGHLCLPVKKECKLKIAGSLMDKSATGSTLFIEPVAVGRCYEEIQSLKMDEENEVRRILYELTDMVAEQKEIIEQNMKVSRKLDFIFSKGKLSLEMKAVAPSINMERRIVLTGARHPLMDVQSCVPLDFRIGDDIRGIVITGPNTGGKTVAIKTVALNCMMAQCGLHVTCREADICMNSNFLCDIGDGQNLSENLSTFSAHITNVLDILQQVNRDSLVIMDELGSGTDPAEGMGIAIAILEELRKSGAIFLVTTHYPEVKQYAQQTEHIVNARMTFDRESLQPLYQLVIGEAGESCAFYIAGRLGMPEAMLRVAAKAAYGNGETGCENEKMKEMEIFSQNHLKRQAASGLKKQKTAPTANRLSEKFHRGDSVMIYPDKKVAIVCQPVNEKGVLQVQLPNRKIWINHKRVKLQVAATELYPEDYDFSIIFDTVANRKLRHDMGRKYVEGQIILEEDSN